MVPCHIYGIWWSREVGDALKLSFGVTMQATGEERAILMGKWRFPLCNTAVVKLYCKSYRAL